MNNWSEVLLKDICDITRGASPRPIHDFMTEDLDGIPWVKIRDATASNTRFIENTKGFIKKEGKNKSVSVISGDLIVSNSATPGLPKIMGIDACIHDGWLLLRNLNGVCKEFLFYLLINDRKQIVSQGTGTIFTNLKTDILKNHQIKLPPISEQEEIASFLGSVDDKIELNQKMNKTLEEIAKTLFKSWFIDFDPVRAKAEGRPTGLSKEISDLFPDYFVDSELGEIPKGWKVENIGNSFEVLLGGTPSRKKEEYWDGDIPWINSGEINNFRVLRPSEFISEEGFKNSSTKLLPKRSTLIAITGATLGQISLNEIEVCANQSVIGIPPSKKVPSEYVYLWISSTVQKLISSQTGGAQQHINTNNVKEHLILLPSENCNNFLKNLLTPVFDKISNNLFEIQALSEIRDTLLPRLISGELQIPDAENLIEEGGN